MLIAFAPAGYATRDGGTVRCQMKWNVKLMRIVDILKSRSATVGSVTGKRPVNKDVAQIVIVKPESVATTSNTQRGLNVTKTFAEVTVTATTERNAF